MNVNKLAVYQQSLILLVFAIISTLIFEHSQLDISISQLFYHHMNGNGNWLIEKYRQPYAFIFYNLPKTLIILLALTLLLMRLQRYWYQRHACNPQNYSMKQRFPIRQCIASLSNRELSYLLLALVIVPAVIALLKSITHVSCPNHLIVFDGEFAYISIWQNMVAKTPAKCFPAAHASAGFALYALAYLPRLHKYQGRIIFAVSVLGWSMGLYKMSIGDHFFSHTLVSMLLSWSMVCAIAALMLPSKKSVA